MQHRITTEEVSEFLSNYFGLTPEELAQTTVTYDDEQNCFSFDFGDVGITATPQRKDRLKQLMGLISPKN